MRYGSTSPHNELCAARACGFWLIFSALLLVALLVPPLLLPLLLVLPGDPLFSAMRREWALAQAPALPSPSRPRTPRGPPRI
jgi:hypothetical protein